jgi:hypothetical protein
MTGDLLGRIPGPLIEMRRVAVVFCISCTTHCTDDHDAGDGGSWPLPPGISTALRLDKRAAGGDGSMLPQDLDRLCQRENPGAGPGRRASRGGQAASTPEVARRPG